MFANALLLIPIVIALIGVAVLIYTYAEEIIWKPCPTCEGQGQVVITTCDGREADACPDCEGSGVTRRLAMFKSCIANVGHVLKHCVLFSVCLLSSIVGLFFMYLGITGSWDPMTILMSMMGVMGLLALLQFYIMPGCEWLGRWEDKTEADMATDEDHYDEIEMIYRNVGKVLKVDDFGKRLTEAETGARDPRFLSYEERTKEEIKRLQEALDSCGSHSEEQDEAEKIAEKIDALHKEMDHMTRTAMGVDKDEVLFW